jgi:uncharacterized membrane protein/protein-disulfide isomerase
MIPSLVSTVRQTARPVFNTPARWALRVLSWLAFGIAAYLAWSAITQTPAAGCVVGSNSGCDAVLNSPWSKWLGVPVAVPGLACYATLAGLSVLLGIQDPRSSRWVTTAFVMLATIAAGASLWFIGLQIFVIGEFCQWCLATDACGIAIGAIAGWCAWRATSAMPRLARVSSSSAGLATLRSALPAGPRTVPVPVAARPSAPMRRDPAPPPLSLAFGGAGAMLLVLIAGQIVFPAKTFEVQPVALNEAINLSGENGNGAAGDAEATESAEPSTRVAMRIPAEENGATENPSEATTDANSTESDTTAASSNPQENAPENGGSSAEQSNHTANNPTESTPAQPVSAQPKLERKVKLLGGKLTLDVYKHPLIGSPDAPNIVVEMISYDCPHCRKTHKLLKQALARYGDQVALVVLVVPMENSCNRLITDSSASHPGACTTARMALGVARLKPGSFGRFHDFLMSGNKDKPPSLDSIIAKAYNTADRTRLRELRTSNELDKEIAANVNLYDSLRKQHKGEKEFGLPVQIIGDHIMTGGIEKADDLYKAWEEHLGVKPR